MPSVPEFEQACWVEYEEHVDVSIHDTPSEMHYLPQALHYCDVVPLAAAQLV